MRPGTTGKKLTPYELSLLEENRSKKGSKKSSTTLMSYDSIKNAEYTEKLQKKKEEFDGLNEEQKKMTMAVEILTG